MTKRQILLASGSRALALLLLGATLSACTASRPPAYSLPSSDELVAGEEITVGRNDNLYTVAQKHGVRIREIIVLNNMSPPYILKPGQSLTLPAKDRYAAPAPKAAPLDRIDKGYMGPASNGQGGAASLSSAGVTAVPLDAPTALQKTEKAQKSSSLPFGVGPSVPDPVPPAAESGAPTPIAEPLTAASVAPMRSASNITTTSKPRATTDAGEMDLPSFKSAPAPTEKTASAASGEIPVFGWPVRGTVISAFGPKGQGLDNDGINIAAPKGAPVKAADGGMVAYAGNDMKGFGNLVLIRHEGGWVTAYAHLDRVVVAKDSIVAKGDMIGSVGTTGGVASPQLHFEARQDGKPVDPELVLK